jgi:hypothetical protein
VRNTRGSDRSNDALADEEKNMIVHKLWKARRKAGSFTTDEWFREGWFLFGIIPLYIRDRQSREKF